MMVDSRVLRTKKRLYKAMGELLEEKAFNEITVTDLTKKAKTTRKTFYTHYQDKIELIEEYQSQLFDMLNDKLKNYKFLDENYIRTYFEMVDKQDALLKGLMSYQGSLEMQNLYCEGMRHDVMILFANQITDKNQLRYVSIIVANGLFGVTQEWLLNGKKESPDEMAKLIVSLGLIPGKIFAENHSK